MNHPLISGKAAVGAVAHGHPDPDDSASGTCALEVRRAVARVRFAEPCAPARVAAALGRTAERWRQRNFEPRRDTIRKLATALEMAPELLDESLEALLEPLGRDRLYSLAANLPAAPRLFGFLMPGNVPGAGIHEVCAAMLAGAGVVIKAASAEPFFFAGFIGSLAEIDAAVAARVAVVSFGRGDASAMREVWASCDGGVVAYGDDATIAALEAGRGARPLAGFASRLSGALVVPAADVDTAPAAAAQAAAAGLARDVTLFEQRGCLSPHHVFVVGGAGQARRFAARLARALEQAARRLAPPRRLPLDAAASIRALRERARWRALAQRPGDDVALWEGDGMGWTVLFDGDSDFCVSPGFRTVHVSALAEPTELTVRLGDAAGRLEAFALAAAPNLRPHLESQLMSLGVTYVCEPGRMQSPPLDWLHGGGKFLELLRACVR